MFKRSHYPAWGASLAALAFLCGCTTTTGNSPSTVRATREDMPAVESSDIVAVSKFFNVNPWLCFNADGSGRVNGVRFALYLQPANGTQGVFGTGTIIVQMYRLDQDEARREVPLLVQEWQYSVEKAYAFRAKQRTYLGWGYGFRLRWNDDLGVEGRQVAFVIKYIRDDGRVVLSSRQLAQVPVHGEKQAAN